MRKSKRKYVRKVLSDNTQSISTPIKEESSSRLLGEVTQADIDMLPPSLKAQLEAGSRMRKAFKLPDNLKERTEQMVRRFRGDRLR